MGAKRYFSFHSEGFIGATGFKSARSLRTNPTMSSESTSIGLRGSEALFVVFFPAFGTDMNLPCLSLCNIFYNDRPGG